MPGFCRKWFRADHQSVPLPCARARWGCFDQADFGVPEVLARGRGAADVAVESRFRARKPFHLSELRAASVGATAPGCARPRFNAESLSDLEVI